MVALLDQPTPVDLTDINGVVEEVLRYTTIADSLARFATRDTEIGGVPIRAGDGVIVTLSAANRDPSVFPDPYSFDPNRTAEFKACNAFQSPGGCPQALGRDHEQPLGLLR